MLVQVTVGIKARNVEKVKKIEIKKEESSPKTSASTANVNELNSPLKRLSDWIKKHPSIVFIKTQSHEVTKGKNVKKKKKRSIIASMLNYRRGEIAILSSVT